MANIPLDYEEYATDAAAQTAYVTNGAGVISSYETIGAVDGSIGDNGGIDYARSRKIVLTSSAYISGVSIYIGTKTGTPTGDLTFRIETNSAAKPSGTLADANLTGTIASGSISQNAWNTCIFTAPVALASATYWLVVSMPAQAANNWFPWLITAGGTGEHGYTAEGGAWIMINYFSPYKLLGYTLQSYSESTIKTQGSYALKGVATTAAINKTLTRTVTPTVNLSDQTILKFDIRSSRTGANIKIGIHDSGGTTTEITPTIASANTFQTVVWDISAVSNANKDAIDSIVITVVNADAANTFYIDNFNCSTVNNVFGIVT